MRIAIASKENKEDSIVCEISGRAPYYLIFDDKKLIETIKNPFANGGGGAGFSVARMMKDKKVELVIAGKIGTNMKEKLDEYGINSREEIGRSIKDIIKNT